MGQRVLFVFLVINCLAGAQVQQSPPSDSLLCCQTNSEAGAQDQQQPPSDSLLCCQTNSEAIANLIEVVNKLSTRLAKWPWQNISGPATGLASVHNLAPPLDVCDPTARVPQDCSDIDKAGSRTSGVYQIYIPSNSIGPRLAYCDLSISRQNWLVFQRRKDGSENFERTWKEYADGFGNLNGEFWLGNEALYVLTNSFNYKLRFDLEDFDGQKRYAEYSSFKIASSADNYRLNVSGYSGDAGDSFSVHSGSQFSTKDADHDMSSGSCARIFHGAWWYADCHASNLNGLYLRGNHSTYADGIEWLTFRGYYYSLKFIEMKIARV